MKKLIMLALVASGLALALPAFAEEDLPDWLKAAPYDCKGCHKIETKLVGPAWKDVAAKYRNDPGAEARLIKKVREGGNGNWNTTTGGMAMAPHPQLTDDQIKKAVDFVLSLKFCATFSCQDGQ